MIACPSGQQGVHQEYEGINALRNRLQYNVLSFGNKYQYVATFKYCV